MQAVGGGEGDGGAVDEGDGFARASEAEGRWGGRGWGQEVEGQGVEGGGGEGIGVGVVHGGEDKLGGGKVMAVRAVAVMVSF